VALVLSEAMRFTPFAAHVLRFHSRAQPGSRTTNNKAERERPSGFGNPADPTRGPVAAAFDSPADRTKGPVALRPRVTAGLPLSTANLQRLVTLRLLRNALDQCSWICRGDVVETIVVSRVAVNATSSEVQWNC
jgi:hypothetical protein